MVVLRNQKETSTPTKTKMTRHQQEVHLVTGGGGFPGFSLCKRLAKSGHRVILFDVREPIWSLKDGMQFVQGDITNSSTIERVFRDVDCVYHMASFGMSGRDQLNRKKIEAVNVGGTKNVIKACLRNDVKRLVYTSTYNVVFGGQTIENGDESLPYLPLEKHPDHYSRTKSIAEQIVLDADGSVTEKGNVLHTCALRLAAVYGPGEQRHIPRIVDNIERGLFCMKYQTDTLQDFLHVENLAQAHQLAGEALTDERKQIAGASVGRSVKLYQMIHFGRPQLVKFAEDNETHTIRKGQTYFVSDEAPVNTFTFFQPLIEGLGYPMPSLRLPLGLIYFVAFLTEWIHYFVSTVYNFQPLLTRTEVYKTGVTHYFSIEKARRELGYSPTIQNDLFLVVQHYINTGHKKQTSNDKQSAFIYYTVNIFIGAMFAILLLSYLPIAR